MTSSAITHRRLHNQQLSSPVFKNPADVVHWLGAVQAQDYYGAKWALGQRIRGATDVDIEHAFTEGTILRTHVMRPTWHFVAPADIRWMLSLTAPRVKAACAYQYRQLELDDALFRKCNKFLAVALRGGKQVTREELRHAVDGAGIAIGSLQRFGHILMRAELDGVICSGARRGKQFTYALLDERVPPARALSRAEALAELTKRYFSSHGPATVNDFVWWSGLTVTDARAGIEMVEPNLVQEVIAGKPHWIQSSGPDGIRPLRIAHFLPAFDEYLIGYKDRSAAIDPAYSKQLDSSNGQFSSTIVIDGRVVGTWKRTLKKGTVIVATKPFAEHSKFSRRAIADAADRYGAFLGLTTVLA